MRGVRGLLLLFLLICSLTPHAAEVLKLLPRSQETILDPGLTQSEWRWVREHRKIRLAVWLPMSPPYDITTGLNDYGGINADYAGLIAGNLGVDIEVVRYPDYAAALAALRAGEADFIAQAGDNQRRDGLLLSDPYSLNRAVEVLNTDDMKGSAIRRVASASAYDPQQVLARYPGAASVAFSTSRHALEALAFRQIDLFFCDEITARYLVSQSNLSNLRIRPLETPFPAAGFSFAARQDGRTWIAILNKLLRALPDGAGVEIHRRWNGGIPLSLSEQRPVYTSLEQKWIKDHPRIRVAVADDNVPVAWFTPGGQLHGIIADILTALRLRTGFSFDVQRYPTQRAALEAVKKGDADLVAGGVQDDIWREALITTRTWLYNSWVMVGREHHPRSAFNPAVVSLDGQSPEGWLQQQSGDTLEKVSGWRQGLDRVARGESDMMAMPLIVANARLAGNAYPGLRILASIDIEPMRYSFGASRRAWPLITILNKALINIPPEDLHALTRGGGAGSGFIAGEAKPGAVPLPLLAGALAALLLALAAVASRTYLRRRERRRLEAVPFPLFICGRDGAVRAANRALCAALDARPEQVAGAPLDRWFDGADPFDGGTSRTRLRDGRTLRLWRAPLPGGKGYIGGWLDLSREARVVQTLRQRRRRADEASRAKSAFLTTMSHEIRTPLSAIIGLLELVMTRPDDARQNPQFIRMASDASRALLQLIGNILDVSRIESGRLVLRPERVSLRALAEEIALLFEREAAKKGLTFTLELDADLRDDALADRSRLRQILVNLAGNAVKFTARGRVTLRAWADGREGGYLTLRAEVEDTGPGIDEATLATLFQPFAQGGGEHAGQGSGLGLYISRSLAQMMGGTLGLHSEPGTGTRAALALRLPVMPPLPEAESPPPAPRPKGALTVLVVDDNPAGRLLLIEQLRRLGHRGLGAQSGEEALRALAASLPDAVIADGNLPGMSGTALADIIRERYPGLAVFGITADARETVRRAALEAGMRDCLFKPVTLGSLEALLAPVLPSLRDEPVPAWPGENDLPAALLEGENLAQFLSLQIEVIDETLGALARWREAEDIPLADALHRLRGGIQLLGVPALLALCEAQEQEADAAGVARLEAEVRRLRAALGQWRDSGLRPAVDGPTAQ